MQFLCASPDYVDTYFEEIPRLEQSFIYPAKSTGSCICVLLIPPLESGLSYAVDRRAESCMHAMCASFEYDVSNIVGNVEDSLGA